MISIIVLNWNTSDMLLRLIKSIKENTEKEYAIIVFDNGSVENEFEKIKALNSKIFVVRNEKNIGFAAGNNAALKYIKQLYMNWIFFINSDIVIQEKGWDSKFIELFSKDEKIGVIGCAYHPLVWTKDGNFHIQKIPSEPVESQSVQGAFFGIKKDLFLELLKHDKYLFDENFKFAHYEETDLCFRSRKLGYKVMWLPCKHFHDYNNSATKKNNYKLNDEIQSQVDFKNNSDNNKKLFIEKHRDIL